MAHTLTPIVSAPYVDAGQDTPEVSHGEGLNALEAGLKKAIEDKDLTAPPGGETNGEQWIVASVATGAWAGEENNIAYYNDGFKFITPWDGDTVWVMDENKFYQFNGSTWAILATASADITDSSGGTPSGTIAAATNIALLIDSSTGSTDNTVAAVSGSGDDTNINNNFAEVTEELIAQVALNTVLINAVASLATEVNEIRARLRTAGIIAG